MASGDTKTEAMLNALGNGGSADEFRGCCNTKTQQYILDAIDRVQNVEDEVEELKNNPDVVDIVDTYADLQAYDTQHLTENDIIRVLQDETHSGNSAYYRFTKNPDTWTFIGEVSGGAETVKTLTSADYNYPTDNPNGLAPWLLDPGLYYTTEAGMNIYDNSSASSTSDGNAFYVARIRSGAKSVLRLVNQNWIYTDYTTTGTRSTSYTLLGNNKIQQTTGSSTSDVMSQKAVTDALASAGGGDSAAKVLTTSDYNWNSTGQSTTAPYDCVALWLLPSGIYRTEANVKTRVNNSTSWNSSTNYCFIVTNYPNVIAEIITIQSNGGDGGTGNAGLSLYKTSPSGSRLFEQSILTSGTLLQATGASTAQAMSQSATTGMVYEDINTRYKVRIGNTKNLGANSVGIGYQSGSSYTSAEGSYSTAVGTNATSGGFGASAFGYQSNARGEVGVALGREANVSLTGLGGIALGAYSTASTTGEMNIGTSNTSYGYNSSNYRLLSGVYDGQNAHDAATVGQINATIDAINTALSTNIPHIGA